MNTNLKIIIDITPLRGKRTGIGNYLFYTLKYLLFQIEEIEYISFSTGIKKFAPDAVELLAKIKRHINIPLPTSLLYKYWNKFSSPHLDIVLPSAHLYHATNYYLPPLKVKSIISIYDLSFLKNVCDSNKKIASLFTPKIYISTQTANHIITCSNYSKAEITKLLGVPSEKITVAYAGIDKSIFYPSEKESSLKELAQKYLIPSPFILFVGTIEERKNIEGLINIFAHILDKLPHYLVIVGKKTPYFQKMATKISALKKPEKVIIIDYVDRHSDLRLFYNSADAFVFPSLEEGFGIPVLEAMACGCPVVSSNKGALPEVVGNGGVTHDPNDIEGFAHKVIRVLTHSKESQRLIQWGLQQSQNFTWEATAKIHCEIYKKVANND